MLPKEFPCVVFKPPPVEPRNSGDSTDCHEDGESEEDYQAELGGPAQEWVSEDDDGDADDHEIGQYVQDCDDGSKTK